MFLITLEIIPINIALKTLVVFAVVLGAISVPLFYFPRAPIHYTIMSNHSTRTYLLIALLPISAYQYLSGRKKLWGAGFYLHLGMSLFCAIVSAGRVNYLIAAVSVLFIFIIFIKEKMFSIKWASLSLIIPVVLCLATASSSIFMYHSLVRLPPTRFVVDALQIEYAPRQTFASDASSNDHDDWVTVFRIYGPEKIPDEILRDNFDYLLEQSILEAAIFSAESSADMREVAWRLALEDIALNPLFGVGLRQYTVSSKQFATVDMPPHNFILDYTLAFGVFGLLLFVAMTALPLFTALKRSKFRALKSNLGVFMSLSGITLLFGASLHSYFLNPRVMALLYLMVGCYSVLIMQEDNSNEVSQI
jgi:hypothetical protein